MPKAKAFGSFISFFLASSNHFWNNSNGLSRSKQHEIYEQQKEIIDYNYNHLVSKQWANLN